MRAPPLPALRGKGWGEAQGHRAAACSIPLMAKSGTRTALLIALQLGAAALALFSVVAFRLSRLLAPSYAVTDWAMLLSAGAIVY